LTIDEFAVLAALADAYREEQLRAFLERRPAAVLRFTREAAERQLIAGQANPDLRWVVAILSRFAPQGWSPGPDALDSGAAALVARRWAKPVDGTIEIGAEITAFCTALTNTQPVMSLAVARPGRSRPSPFSFEGYKTSGPLNFMPDQAISAGLRSPGRVRGPWMRCCAGNLQH